MTITYHYDVIQRTEEWSQLRCGILTASEIENIIQPKKLLPSEPKDKDDFIELVYEKAAQRINQYVEPTFQSFDMMRGLLDEPDAKIEYEKHYAPIKDCGFVTNDKFGFVMGFSPDGLVGDDGQVQCKSRKQSFQIKAISKNRVPKECVIQMQSELLISERAWSDYITWCGGMKMAVIRMEADKIIQDAIVSAATLFNDNLNKLLAEYKERIEDPTMRLIDTKRRPPESEILV